MSHIALNIDIARPNESLIYKRGYSRFIHHILVVGDLIFLNFSFLLAYTLRFPTHPAGTLPERFLTLLLVSNMAWLVNVYFFNIYAVSRVSSWETIVWNIIKALISHALIIALFVLTIKGYYYSRIFFAINYGILTIAIFCWRTLFVKLIKNHRISGYNFRNVVIVGANQASFKIYNYFLSEKSHGYKLTAIFGDEREIKNKQDPFFYPEGELYNYLATERVDEIYCALPLTEHEQ